MRIFAKQLTGLWCALCLLAPGASFAAAAQVLPSWKDTQSRQAIVEFVERVTQPGTGDYVPPAERIATFDNDGTLWAEQPMYFQLLFALDRVKAMSPQHPEWQEQEPFAAVLRGDTAAALEGGTPALMELVMASHANMTTDEFQQTVLDWLDTARHPTTGRPFTEMIYQPMLELLDYLRANGFTTYITSGGGIEFMRPWVESVYGIPPEQVIGSSIVTRYEVRDGQSVLVRLPKMDFLDDKEGKPVAINKFIGRRPIMAGGNSDGDFQMLEWVTAGDGPRFGLLIHHTDADREWAYDRNSHIGQLKRGLDEAPQRDWTVVDMKQDWKTVFPARD